MKIASLADVKSHLSAYVKESQHGPIVVTRNGKAVAVLLAVTDEDELERLILAHSPKFQAILSKSRQQIEATGGIPHDNFWAEATATKKGNNLVAKEMTKKCAIARFNERGGHPQTTKGNPLFANISKGKRQVWRIDIPLRILSRASKDDLANLLLYDHKNDKLHHLAVPAEYLSKNRTRLVTRVEKQCISLELSINPSELFTDVRPKGDRVSFAQFLQSTN